MLLNKAPARAPTSPANNNCAIVSPRPVREGEWRQSIRYSDQPMSLGTRLFGICGVTTIALVIIGGVLFTWQVYTAPTAAQTLSVFDVKPPASPSETPLEEEEALKPIEEKTSDPEPPQVRPIEPSKIQILPVTVQLPVVVPKPADPGPVEPETAPPQNIARVTRTESVEQCRRHMGGPGVGCLE